jgi:hypothetical protein
MRINASLMTIRGLACLFSLVATSCTSQNKEEDTKKGEASVKEEATVCTTCKTEEAFPGKPSTPKTMTIGNQTLHYLEIEGQAVFEGDIILSKDFIAYNQDKASKKGLLGARIEGRRWPKGEIAYTIDKSLADSQRVALAIKHWELKTPIRFKRKTKTDVNWLTFKRGEGCSSDIGMIGKQQYIDLADGCGFGNTIHEVGHAVGLFHENSRTDRDTHLVVNWDNIQDKMEGNFKTYLERGYAGADDGSFDFNSRMLYEPYAFAKDKKKPTITKKDGSTYTVNWTTLSAGDIQTINNMYTSL